MSDTTHPEGTTRREFIVLTAQAMGALGAAAVAWPFIDSMNPSADVVAAGMPVDVDLSPVEVGQEIKVMWRGNPIFIRHRTADDIKAAQEVDVSELRDPQTDADRVKKDHEQWLVQIGVCTHLGCIPVGGGAGDYHGWFCPCHGSHYDTSGRIRKGPAPVNLLIPPYAFLDDNHVRIG